MPAGEWTDLSRCAHVGNHGTTDGSFSTEAERVRAFIAQQGGCRATYYNHARRLGRPLELPELQLHHLPPDWTPDAAVSLLDLLLRRFGTLGRDQPL